MGHPLDKAFRNKVKINDNLKAKYSVDMALLDDILNKRNSQNISDVLTAGLYGKYKIGPARLQGHYSKSLDGVNGAVNYGGKASIDLDDITLSGSYNRMKRNDGNYNNTVKEVEAKYNTYPVELEGMYRNETDNYGKNSNISKVSTEYSLTPRSNVKFVHSNYDGDISNMAGLEYSNKGLKVNSYYNKGEQASRYGVNVGYAFPQNNETKRLKKLQNRSK